MMYATVKPNFRKNTFFFPELNQFVNQVRSENHAAPAFRPAANITEVDSNFVIEVAAPGFAKADFSIKVEKEILTISAKKEAKANENEKVIRREFNFASFERTFHLNEKIDSENIVAQYENGILEVVLAKKAEVQPEIRNINIA